jgi:hypothetical protein
VVELPWAADSCPCVENKLRTVLPVTVGIRDSGRTDGWGWMFTLTVRSTEPETIHSALGAMARHRIMSSWPLSVWMAGPPLMDHTYGDEKVSNRDTKVWHGATENGP